jgi:hypothetical protein
MSWQPEIDELRRREQMARRMERFGVEEIIDPRDTHPLP